MTRKGGNMPRRPPVTSPADKTQSPSEAGDPDSQEVIAQKYNAFLAANGIIKLPSAEGWEQNLRDANYFGLLITALLLSLGAPFWYSTLGRLLQLQFAELARKDDAQRAERQLTASSPAATSDPNRSSASVRNA